MPTIRLDPRLRLVLLSFLMLFVELALIRWLGSNVLYLSYFSNFVLLGSFLGIGVGFLRGKATTNTFRWAPLVLALLVAFVLIFKVQIDRINSDVIYFGVLTPSGLPTWITLPVIFLAVAAVMAMIGEGVARQFVEFEPLEAYRWDIVGSVLGIGSFSLLSFLWAPPVAWGLVVAVLFVLLERQGWRLLQLASVAAIVLILGSESLMPQFSWSPYYRVEISPVAADRGRYQINVNGIPHQSIRSVESRRRQTPVYFFPYQRSHTALDNVLIVGAGTGSDVAIALAQGAKHVDAVEIDPRLYRYGVQLHPDKPYQDPRVSVHINDGRAFLEQTDAAYDLILFALPDSLTLVQGQSSLRLESYLFTRESIDSAREHLKPGGAFAMYNYYREAWLLDRYAGTLEAAFGHPPCVDSVGRQNHLAALTVGLDAGDVDCPPDEVFSSTDAPPPATDDYPFPYLRERGIPSMYLLAMALILGTSLVLVRGVGGPFRQMRPYVDLFFMGTAFLLLETKSVVQFALLFGTTWFVNALVFGGVLLSVLAAIEVTRRSRLPRPLILYAVLLVAVIIGFLIQPHVLLGLPFWPRLVAAVVIYFTPIFAANLVFAQRFRDVESSNLGFGANLLGSMVGGLLEYLALVTGYQALALLVAVLYVLALVVTPRVRAAAA